MLLNNLIYNNALQFIYCCLYILDFYSQSQKYPKLANRVKIVAADEKKVKQMFLIAAFK